MTIITLVLHQQAITSGGDVLLNKQRKEPPNNYTKMRTT